MPAEEEPASGRSKRLRKMSKKQKRAMGLPSASESDSSSTSNNSEDDHRPPTGAASQSAGHTTVSTLQRSQSTASVISLASAPGNTPQVDDTEEKRTKFDERFRTATSSDEEVLRKFLAFLFHSFN